jgi:hypothetical protein
MNKHCSLCISFRLNICSPVTPIIRLLMLQDGGCLVRGYLLGLVITHFETQFNNIPYQFPPHSIIVSYISTSPKCTDFSKDGLF